MPESPHQGLSDLQQRLDSLRSTLKHRSLLNGLALTVITACSGLALAFVADLFWNTPSLLRAILLAAIAVTLVVLLVRKIIQPALRTISDPELAALVEDAHPELEERLLLSLELSRPDGSASRNDSPLMRQMLLKETDRTLRQITFDSVVDTRPAVRKTIIACTTFLLVLAPFLFLHEGYGNLWARLLTPFGNHSHGINLTLQVTPGSVTIPSGEDVDIRVTPQYRFGTPRPLSKPRIRWVTADGYSETRELKGLPDQLTVSATLPQVTSDLTYRIESAQATSQEYHLQVLDRPSLTGLTVDVQPPAYSGRAAQRIDGVVGELTLFEHSTLKFQATFNKPVAEIRWIWLDDIRRKYQDQPVTATGPDLLRSATQNGLTFARTDGLKIDVDHDGRSAAWTIPAEREGSFELILIDQADLQNRHEPARSIRLLRDQPPSLAWVNSEERSEARPDDLLNFQVEAADDIGLGTVELHYAILPERTVSGVLSVERSLLGHTDLKARFPLDLRSLTLTEGSLVSIKARAADERPVPGPNETWTGERVIAISRTAAASGSAELDRRHQRLRDELASLRQAASNLENEAMALKQQIRRAAANGLNPEAIESELNQMLVREEQLSERLQQFADSLKQEGLMDHLRQPLLQTVSEDVAPAINHTVAAQKDQTSAKANILQNAQQELGEATIRLSQLEDRFEGIAKLERDLLELNRIADKTGRLAEDVRSFEEQQQELSKLRPPREQAASASRTEKLVQQRRQTLLDEQRDLSNSLQQILDRRPEVIDAARSDLMNRLVTLANQAETLSTRQNSLADSLDQQAAPPAPPVADAATVSSPDNAGPPAASDSQTATPEAPEDDTPKPTPAPGDQVQATVADQQQVSNRLTRAASEAAVHAPGTPLQNSATDLIRKAERASEMASLGQLKEAAALAQDVAKQAEQLAAKLDDNPVTQGGPAPELAEQLRTLASEQTANAAKLETLSADPSAQTQARIQGQRQLEADTRSLQEEFHELADQLQARPVDRPLQSGQATDASQQSESAHQAMQQARQQTEQGQTGPAADQARKAARDLKQVSRTAREERGFEPAKDPDNPVPDSVGRLVAEAARQLEAAGQNLKTPPAPKSQPTDEKSSAPSTDASDQAGDKPPPSPDSPAENAQNDPSGEQSTSNEGLNPGQQAQSASDKLQKGAHSLRQAASQMKLRPGDTAEEGKEGGSQGESQPTSGQTKQGSAAGANEQVRIVDLDTHLKKLSTRNWGQLPGKLQTEILQSTRRKPDGEYAPQIRRYFENLSRTGIRAEPVTPTTETDDNRREP